SAWWEYNTTALAFDAVFAKVQQVTLEVFAEQLSKALQKTMWSISSRIIADMPEIYNIRMQCSHNHPLVEDLSRFGQDNPNVVFYAADRPYGDITSEVVRKGTTPNPAVWNTVPSFT